jgi:hypothetical protein
MGIFSGIAAGFSYAGQAASAIGGAVLDVGRNIVTQAANVGQFMGEVAVTGAVGLMNALPGVGAAFADGLVATTGALFGTDSAVTTGVQALMDFTGRVVTTGANTFTNITRGVVDTVSAFSKTAAKKMGFDVKGASANFFGDNSAFSKSFGDKSRFSNLTKSQADIDALTSAFDSVADADPVVNFDLQSFEFGDNLKSSSLSDNVDRAIAEPVNFDRTLGLGKETLGQAVGLEDAVKPSLLQRGYEGTKNALVKGVKAGRDEAVKEITAAPEKLITEYVSEQVKKGIYGEEEFEPVNYGAQGNQYAGFDGSNIARTGTIQSYSQPVNPARFASSWQPSQGNWGYNAAQSNMYGQRMSQLYNPQKV